MKKNKPQKYIFVVYFFQKQIEANDRITSDNIRKKYRPQTQLA